ncbi:MAG: hypothetical protein H7A19_08915 [Rhodanobacteraceae bacterium]|nr:hypothetical protein [Rhodanobacteraceae bacterium]
MRFVPQRILRGLIESEPAADREMLADESPRRTAMRSALDTRIIGMPAHSGPPLELSVIPSPSGPHTLAILTSLVQQPAFPLKSMKSYASQLELAHPGLPSQNRTRQEHFASGRRRLIDRPSRILHACIRRQFHRLAVSAANSNAKAPRNANVVVHCAHHSQ